MIKSLKLVNVGPAAELELELSQRVNIFTGDNGLGKSFLLDIMWWALTRSWPRQINYNVNSGYMAKPIDIKKEAIIHFNIFGKTKKESPSAYIGKYSPRDESWVGKAGRPINPGLVIYAMSDGSFALWDPSRNYWLTKNNKDTQDKVPAFIYTQKEVWEGNAKSYEGSKTPYFNGLINDWILWQDSLKQDNFNKLKEVLKELSSEGEMLEPGELKPFSLEDSRLYPTIKMPYGDVLLPYASAGVKRIITLAYFIVATWAQHQKSSEVLGEEPTRQITFLIDEMEAHLHPKWQRKIVPALLKVMNYISKDVKVQLVTATHSPLVMSSLESFFNDADDVWFDFDLSGNAIKVEKMQFQHFGTAENWLTSEAFDLKSTRDIEIQKLIDEATNLVSNDRKIKPTISEIEKMLERLSSVLDSKDRFLFRWRYICEKKGWLK